MSDARERLLARRSRIGRKPKIDLWIEQNPEREQDLRELLQAWVDLKAEGHEVGATHVCADLSETFGLEVTTNTVLDWVRREYRQAKP